MRLTTLPYVSGGLRAWVMQPCQGGILGGLALPAHHALVGGDPPGPEHCAFGVVFMEFAYLALGGSLVEETSSPSVPSCSANEHKTSR